MKTFTFKYSPDEPSISQRVKAAAAGKKFVHPDYLYSKSLKGLFDLATEARIEIFAAILKYHPESVYELAEKIGKSQPYILKEVRILESIGLIQILKEFDGKRERFKPVALYSKIVIDCRFEEQKAS